MNTIELKGALVNQRKSIFCELTHHCHLSNKEDFIEVTEWTNGEGYDITTSNRIGTQMFSITSGEFELLSKIIENFDSIGKLNEKD